MGPFPSYRWDKLKKDAAGMAQSPGINLTGWRRTGNRLYAALAGLGVMLEADRGGQWPALELEMLQRCGC